MKTYIITLTWNGGTTEDHRMKFESRKLADQHGRHLQNKKNADEVFVIEEQRPLSSIMNASEITMKPVPVL